MAQTKKCFKCQKEISSGKFYIFYTGKKGGKRILRYELRQIGKDFFCPTCATSEKANPTNFVSSENLLETEWEIGNKTDEEILEFEEKWWKYYINNQFTEEDKDTNEKTILNWCRETKQELELYLQKPEAVEKSFGGKLKGCGNHKIWFYYLFAKSAEEEKYRQEVVEPTIAKILGVAKLNQSVNTTIRGKGPGVPGRADGTLEIGNKQIVDYSWTDGQAGFFRRIFFEVSDPLFALRSFCRGLEIKEKELKGDNSPTQPEKDSPKNPEKNNNMEPDRKIIKQYFLSNDFRFVQLNDDNSLMTLYYENKSSKKTPKHKNKSEWTTEEKHIESYLKKHNKIFLTRTEVDDWTDIKISNQAKPLSNPTNWTLIISLSVIGIILLGGLVWFLGKKQNQRKK